MSDLYQSAWKKLKDVIKTEKTSWGRNELLIRMSQVLEDMLEQITKEAK